MHPYFAVNNLQSAKLSGLKGVPYVDRYELGEVLSGPEMMRWSEAPCEMLFDGAPRLTLSAGESCIEMATSGFDQWMVWNPGKEGAKAIGDLPDDDWSKFICIEPVCVNRPVVLMPGERFVGKFEISFSSCDAT